MGNSNKYEDMSVIEALKHVKDSNMLLPDIQRKFVWKPTDIEYLFESVVDGYPIGSCIMWKTSRKNLNKAQPNLYYFLREYSKDKSENEKAPEVFSDETDYYIVLDGQQRITSFNIALFGSYETFRGGRGYSTTDPKNWLTRELYYNLDFYNRNEEDEDDENPKKRFSFLTVDEAKSGNWYKIKQLIAFDDIEPYLVDLINKGYSQEVRHDLSILFQRINASSNNGLIHYYCIVENDYDEALDIFVRVNSTGEKLSKSDLIFSTLIDGWKEGKENIDNLLKTMNSKCKGGYFYFNRDYLMRLALVLVDAATNLKIQSLTKKTILEIRNNWGNIESAAEKMAKVISEVGLSDATLTSYNATMPLVYFLYKGGKLDSADAKKEVRKFLSVSMAKRLFGVASNSALSNTRTALQNLDCKRTAFSLSLFENVSLVGGRNFKVTKDDVDYWLDNYEKGQNTYVLLAMLYPHLKLNQVDFHQDHCHPHVGFETKRIKSLNLPAEKVSDWQRKRNLLPNLQFLEGSENEAKNETPLIDWINQGNTIEYCPDGVSFELQDFDAFFAARRILIKKKLFEIFDLTYDETDAESDQRRA